METERDRNRTCTRSASLITNAVFGLPIRVTSHCTLADLIAYVKLLMGHYVGGLRIGGNGHHR